MFDTYSSKSKYLEERRKLKALEESSQNVSARSKMEKKGFSMKQMSAFFIIALFMLSIPISMNLVQRKEATNKSVKASETEVQFYLFPNDNQVVKDISFDVSAKLVIPADYKTSSVMLSFQFDKTHLRLNSINPDANINPDVNNAASLKMLKTTSIENANSTGRFKLFLAADDESTTPGGAVNLARLNFTILSYADSNISLDTGASQVTLTNGKFAVIKINGVTTVNSYISPTPVVSSSPTPSYDLTPPPVNISVAPTAVPISPEVTLVPPVQNTPAPTAPVIYRRATPTSTPTIPVPSLTGANQPG